MKNPFFNYDESRIRALFRLLMFIFFFVFTMGIPSLIPFSLIEYIGRSAITLGLLYLFFRFVDQRSWSYAGLEITRRWIKECVAGIGIAAVVMGLIFFTQWQTGTLEITGYGWERSQQQFWVIPLLVFLVQMMSVGFYEELMARGYLIPNITEGLSFGKISPQTAAIFAVIISSAIFGLGHAGNPNASITAVFNIVLAGIMLAVPFLITGRLALSIGLHFSWNFFQGGIFGFRVSGLEIRTSIFQVQQGGPEWWTGGSFGPEAGLIGIIGIVLILVISVLYLKWTGVKIDFAQQFKSGFLELKALNTLKE